MPCSYEILRQRYVEVVRQRAVLLKHHAEKMQYPQFRDRLLRIAMEKSKHAGWIAEDSRTGRYIAGSGRAARNRRKQLERLRMDWRKKIAAPA